MNKKVTAADASAHGGRLWFPSAIHLPGMRFVRRIVSSRFGPVKTGEVTDVLCFAGMEHLTTWRFIGAEKSVQHPRVEAWVIRQTREEAIAEMSKGRDLYPFTEAFEDDRARKFAERWDTLLQFDGIYGDTPRVTVSTYADPHLFDRFLTMPLKDCILSAGLKIGVLLHAHEVGRGENAIQDLSVLPAPEERPWGERHQPSLRVSWEISR